MVEVIAYAYNAALHCNKCTKKWVFKHYEHPRIAWKDLESGEGLIKDDEGNFLTPIFNISEDWQGECCDDCFELLGE